MTDDQGDLILTSTDLDTVRAYLAGNGSTDSRVIAAQTGLTLQAVIAARFHLLLENRGAD